MVTTFHALYQKYWNALKKGSNNSMVSRCATVIFVESGAKRPSREKGSKSKSIMLLLGQTVKTFPVPKLPSSILTPAIFRALYLAIVRRRLDCAVQASFPYLKKDIKLIRRVQRIAPKCAKSFRRQPYPERPHELKQPSIGRHFPPTTLKTVYKLFHGYLNLSAGEFFQVLGAS